MRKIRSLCFNIQEFRGFMKKLLFVCSLGLSLTTSAFAEIIHENIYQNEFEVARSANFIHIDWVKVKNVAKVVDRVENPLFDSYSGEPVYHETVLETEKVVQISISYHHQDSGAIESESFVANLPLSLFSTKELASRKELYQAVKNKVSLKTKETSRIGSEEFCKDFNFDPETTSMENCHRIGTREVTYVRNNLKISLK